MLFFPAMSQSNSKNLAYDFICLNFKDGLCTIGHKEAHLTPLNRDSPLKVRPSAETLTRACLFVYTCVQTWTAFRSLCDQNNDKIQRHKVGHWILRHVKARGILKTWQQRKRREVVKNDK